MTNLSHFGTEMYLSRAKTVTVCSLSYSWWEGPDVPDVIRPELPAGRSGPVRAFTDVACRTGPDVRSGPVPAGRVRRPVVPYFFISKSGYPSRVRPFSGPVFGVDSVFSIHFELNLGQQTGSLLKVG